MRVGWALLGFAVTGCGPVEPPLFVAGAGQPAMPFCTRTLGVAECFADPENLPNRPSPLGDIPVRVHRVPPWWRAMY